MADLGLVAVLRGSILLVEDDEEVADTLRQILEQDGHEVRVAPDVPRASELISEREPEVIVSDIYMPGLTGMDLLGRLRHAGVEAEVILMSGEPSLDTAREAVRLGAFDYLVKPVSGRALRRAVAEALERRRARRKTGLEREAEKERLRELERAVEHRTAELLESRERYRQLVEGLPLAVYELDAATLRFTYAGGRLLQRLSCARAEGGWLECVHDADRGTVQRWVDGLPTRGRGAEAEEFRLVASDGQVIWVRNVVDGEGAPSGRVSGFLVDVTEQRIVDAERRRLEQELLEARTALDHALVRQLDLGSGGRAVRIEEPDGAAAQGADFGRSPLMRKVSTAVELATEHEEPVLIAGETGTGKGVVAEWIHSHGTRRAGRFVALNCSCLRGDLLDSELFGHARGAFTSAIKDRRGLIEEASGGTLFLDEIGEMSLETQARLLKVLEDKTFRRIGDSVPRKSDFRLLCATNRSLTEEVARGRFRQDLYFRINVFSLTLPPLRERPGDVALLAQRLLASLSAAPVSISDEALALLEGHLWPGNVRELRNVLIRASLLARGQTLRVEHFPDLTASAPAPHSSAVASATPGAAGDEADRIRELMQRFDGNVAKVARALGLSRTTLYRRLERLGIAAPR